MSFGDLIPWNRGRAPVSSRENISPLAGFQGQVNRLFDEFWRDFDGTGSFSDSSFGFPRVELSESAQEVKIEVELPGLDQKDVEVWLQDGVLTVRGEKKSETEDRERRLSERYYGRFERRIKLPVEVQENKVDATFAKGILTVRLPKSQQAVEKAKRIAIRGD